MKMRKLTYIAIACASLGLVSQVSALDITPDSPPPVLTGTATSQAVIDAEISAFVLANFDCVISLAYKQDVGGGEEGPFASSYSTEFFNTPTDPQEAVITYGSGPVITGEHIFLLVKDGNQDPSYYFFDITTWNGTETLNLSGFWPDQGAISHVAIYTCPPGGGNGVPDGGSTVALLGVALGGLEAVRRMLRARKA
jgi:hypothetical protein